MNARRLEQLRRLRDARRQTAQRKLEEARRLVRRREAVVSSEQRKLDEFEQECNDLMAAGRPDEAASAEALVLADHQLSKMRQRIANQREVVAKAVQARDEAKEKERQSAKDVRVREQKIEALDRQIKDIESRESRESLRRADDEAEETARLHTG